MTWLALAFLATAALYASVGFGGGSTYNALLVLGGADFRVVPVIALVCNLIVAMGGTVAALRAGRLHLDTALPMTLAAVPMALVGGATPIQERTFTWLLGLSLCGAGLVLLARPQRDAQAQPGRGRGVGWLLGVPLGAAFGLLAGLVGIGGGIFLAPILHLTRAARPKVIAAAASFFILANSVAGLAGQALKLRGDLPAAELARFVWLPVAVLVGGQLGTRVGLHRLSEQAVRRLTALLVLYVGLRLLSAWGRLG